MKHDFYKLVLITQKLERDLDEYLNFIKLCVHNGVTSVQLREKNLDYTAAFSFALCLKKLLSPLKIPLIINDNLKLALDIDADGLHLGQSDGDVIKARKELGENKILGLTVNSIKQLLEANTLPINYIGVGAIFPTKNKLNIQKIWGYSGLKKAVKKSTHKVVAIGGINLNNINEILDSGTHGIAAIGAFHDSSNPVQTTAKLSNLMKVNTNAI